MDVSGLKFLDNDNTHTPYVIPPGTTIAPGAFLVLEEAQFGFGLGAPDSARLLQADGTTVVDTFTWTQHAATTYGRCPDATGSMITTLASSKGGPNVCLSSIPAEAWPGSATVTIVDNANAFAANGSGGTNMSGLMYEASGTNDPGVLWAVQNGPGTMYRLIWSGGKWIPDPSNGWVAGKALHYTDGTGDVDAEGVTFTSAGPAAGVYVSSERNNLNNTVSKLAVLRYDVAGAATSLNAAQQWDLTADLPAVGANLGLEAITWVPDAFLTGRGFFDETLGHAYNPADYPTHGTGLFFVGVEASGLIYGYALNTDGTFNRVATVVTGFTGVMDLRFDADRGDFWVVCDDTCAGRSELMTIGSSGAFGIAHLYERPAGMGNFNNEGVTTAADYECVDGRKPAFWSDDNNTDGHALRAGTVPCNFARTATTTSVTFGPGPFVYTGTAFVATASVSPAGTATITYAGDCTNAGITCTATATYAGDVTQLPSNATVSITIDPLSTASLTRVTRGNDDDRDRDDEEESAGRSGAYRVGASCGGGTLGSALLNGVAVTDGQVVLLKFNPKKHETKRIGRGTSMFRGEVFNLVVTCVGGGGTTATATATLERPAASNGHGHDDDRGRGDDKGRDDRSREDDRNGKGKGKGNDKGNNGGGR